MSAELYARDEQQCLVQGRDILVIVSTRTYLPLAALQQEAVCTAVHIKQTIKSGLSSNTGYH